MCRSELYILIYTYRCTTAVVRETSRNSRTFPGGENPRQLNVYNTSRLSKIDALHALSIHLKRVGENEPDRKVYVYWRGKNSSKTHREPVG